MREAQLKAPRGLLSLGAVLAAALLAGAALVFARFLMTGRNAYSFLYWNLFLAFVPFLLAAAVQRVPSAADAKDGGSRAGRAAAGMVLGLAWLLFFPNAPYIFTDFIHVVKKTFLRAEIPGLPANFLLWYDLVLVSTCALAAHAAGLFSMYLIQARAEREFGRLPGRLVVGAAALASGFGIYLGRFARLNSWDILVAPHEALAEVAEFVQDPWAILLCLAYSLFVGGSYFLVRAFKRFDIER